MRPSKLWLVAVASSVAVACGEGVAPLAASLDHRNEASSAQTCTVTNIRGMPVAGTVCGGASYATGCAAGSIYKCRNDVATNNCTLDQTCTSGCLTRSGSGQLQDSCFSGTAPFALAAPSVVGGSQPSVGTVTLADAHPGGAIVNMRVNRGDLVAARFACNVPDLPAGTSSATFSMPTGVVSAATPVSLYADIAYRDAAGISRELVSHASTLTLNPGGTAPPPPPLSSFTLSPASVAPGSVSIMDVVLQSMAPVPGVPVSVASSDPAVASVIANGQPFVQPGCTKGGGAETLSATNSLAQTTTVQISASSGAPGQAPLTNPFTVTAGCTPLTCLDLAPGVCSGPDGCGGTLACGCPGGQTCGGGGTAGVCGSSATLAASALSLSPTTVSAGASATGIVTLNMAAPSGGAAVFLSSSSPSAQVPQSVVVPAGQTSASFTIASSAVSSSTTATISATLAGTVTATLTILPEGVSEGGTATGSPVTLSVTATGRSGVTVLSSPAGISVPVGQTGSATFPSGTSVTLRLSDRTAFWSGACATSRDTGSCTFTIGGNAVESANVK